IRLPPIDEQRRIVSCIEELAAKVREARQLRMQNAALGEVLYRSALAAAIRPHLDSWEQKTMSDVILSMDAGWMQPCEHRCPKGSSTSPKTTFFRPNFVCLPSTSNAASSHTSTICKEKSRL